jgi:RNA polymerase sigma-70 factor (ECF subfamily)
MAHLQAGHADALAILFDRYHRLVLSIAMKILRDVGEAEDLMQSVFLEIYKSAAQFDPTRGTTKVWILQYAYHRGMNRRQHLNVRNFYKEIRYHEPTERCASGRNVLLRRPGD